MKNNQKELYIHTISGDSYLVEIYESSGGVSIAIAGKKIGLEINSALDLADAILMTVSDIE